MNIVKRMEELQDEYRRERERAGELYAELENKALRAGSILVTVMAAPFFYI